MEATMNANKTPTVTDLLNLCLDRLDGIAENKRGIAEGIKKLRGKQWQYNEVEEYQADSVQDLIDTLLRRVGLEFLAASKLKDLVSGEVEPLEEEELSGGASVYQCTGLANSVLAIYKDILPKLATVMETSAYKDAVSLTSDDMLMEQASLPNGYPELAVDINSLLCQQLAKLYVVTQNMSFGLSLL